MLFLSYILVLHVNNFHNTLLLILFSQLSFLKLNKKKTNIFTYAVGISSALYSFV